MVNSREYGAQHDDKHRSRKGERSGCQRLGAGIVSNVRRQKNERDRQNGECDRHCWRTLFRGHDLLEFGLDQFVGTLSEMFQLMESGYFVERSRPRTTIVAAAAHPLRHSGQFNLEMTFRG